MCSRSEHCVVDEHIAGSVAGKHFPEGLFFGLVLCFEWRRGRWRGFAYPSASTLAETPLPIARHNPIASLPLASGIKRRDAYPSPLNPAPSETPHGLQWPSLRSEDMLQITEPAS